ncbi:transcription termination factor NusA [Patescibacteria group bacterium]|nr:transcription termination factor NusA [Patescibacteria group bacterium]
MGKEVQKINIKELSSAISQICDEKGIEKGRVMEIVEDALAAAYKKDYGRKGQVVKAKFDAEKQTATFFRIMEVVDESIRQMEQAEEEETEKDKKQEQDKEETLPHFNKERDIPLKEAKKIKKGASVGDELEIELEAQNSFGRVAAQNAKQVIIQKLREAERETLYEEFKNKEGEVITATVQRVENRNVFLDLGKMVGVLFPPDQVETENYRTGQRIKVYVEKVDKDAKDTSVTLSRVNPNLVIKLFSLEVPEIFSGAVKIVSIAREPGSRSKIAVKSEEEGIDPIGSCVGQKGIRVQAVIDELGGEKIDIIEHNDDYKIFISHALAPAKVKYVELDEKGNQAKVIVDADQLSLAIGKRGQNVRLAARLTGWKIDVEKESASAEATADKEGSLKEGEKGESPDSYAGADKAKEDEGEEKTDKKDEKEVKKEEKKDTKKEKKSKEPESPDEGTK